jgi:glycosyltransferase involved in cell wall biosynthesis
MSAPLEVPGGAGPDRSGAGFRILHTLAPAPAGGLETVVQELATGQHRRGHRVRVLAFVDPGGEHPFEAPLRSAGVDVRMCRVPGRAYLETWRLAGAEIRDFAPDVVHSHGYRSDLLDAEAARRQRIPTVTTVHGSSFLGGATRLWEGLQLWNLRRFDAVVSVSNPLTELLVRKGVPAGKVHTIPNAWSGRAPGLDRSAARAALGLHPAPEGPVIGFVGRLIPVKDAGLLLDALELISELDWQAVIVGDGPDRVPLTERLRGSRIRERVRFAGAVERAGDLFPAFDLFVLSSRSEGTPMVLFEAMAAEVPVVATAVGGVPDVLGSGGGLLAPPGDPRALAQALEAVLLDPGAARLRAGTSRARLSEVYSPGTWLDRHDRVYERIARRRGPPG